MSLKDSAMLVKMKIRKWDPYKLDKRATENVEVAFKTDGKAGNFSKELLNKKILKPVTSVISTIRFEHARMTVPWTYEGVSILPSSMYLEYTTVMRELTPQLKSAVQNLADQMPIHLANQQSKLGDLFNLLDYPSREELLAAYEVTHSFFPVPETNHFVLDLEAVEMAKIKQDLQKNLVVAENEALSHLYERVRKVVEHVYERLADPANIFRDSLVENIQQLVMVLPRLNVFNDETLTKVCHEMSDKLLNVDAQELRTNAVTRWDMAQNAFDIIGLLKGPQPERMAA